MKLSTSIVFWVVIRPPDQPAMRHLVTAIMKLFLLMRGFRWPVSKRQIYKYTIHLLAMLIEVTKSLNAAMVRITFIAHVRTKKNVES